MSARFKQRIIIIIIIIIGKDTISFMQSIYSYICYNYEGLHYVLLFLRLVPQAVLKE
jgi:hypothetical protein